LIVLAVLEQRPRKQKWGQR